ncbi:MAG: carboxypeptidase M32 [Planctomycetes bacterium]|nr:carboxypeptidase M32 [Planctomycetota bacterium]
MSGSKAYAALIEFVQQTSLLSSASALLSWDQETGMPPGGGDARARQLALLGRLQHERQTDPRMADWLQACAADETLAADPVAAANVRELQRDHARATKLPGALVAALAETESRAQQAWAEARTRSDFAAFAPWLQKLLHLHQQKADCLRAPTQSRWDALADLFEPGLTAAALHRWFLPLRARLVELRQRLAAGTRPADGIQQVALPQPAQEAFVRAVIGAMGFDFQRGRLDRSAHPFCTGTLGDVRLTTRFHDALVLDALGSTMHEAGHGLYEQGLPEAHAGTPLAEACSLGIHESQSRFWENHVGRSRAFWHWCQPLLQRHFGAAAAAFSTDDLWRTANIVEPSLIRVEADEATYDLHVMIRCELEVALLAGDLPVGDLPAAWNRAYADYLGVQVPDDRRGCLQDVHWSCGLFGYFPTYTLGNLYAAQFAAALQRDLPVDDLVARGEFAPLRSWLQAHVHAHGRRYPPAELCVRATGSPLSAEPFLAYLDRKFTAVYQVR